MANRDEPVTSHSSTPEHVACFPARSWKRRKEEEHQLGRMENAKLRVLMILEIQLLWVVALSVHGYSSRNHENVIDLLAALNTSQPIKGVSRLQGKSPGTVVYRLRPRAPYLTLPHEYSHLLYSTLQGTIGVHLVARQEVDSSATLLSLSSSSSPVLQIISSTHSNTLFLEYQAETGDHSPTSLSFPKRNPFSGAGWVQLALSLEPDGLTVFIDCQEAVVLQRKREERINLVLPQDVVVTLASTPGKSDSKFSGYLKTAEISVKAFLRRPWHCDNVTDTVTSDSWVDSSRAFQHDASSSKPQTSHKPQDQPTLYPQDVQSDQLHRGVVLGPPASHQAAKSGHQTQEEQRLKKLEEKVEELALMLDMVKAQVLVVLGRNRRE
ncbi:hypothetical protein LDENG_00246960 [Lucifuga dentata]|nr:hypothetical protein LDENG_00246960 [Lucifuga dentata]